MNYIDFIILAIIFLLIWLDFKRGFILSSLLLCSWIGSLVIAFASYQPLSSLIHKIVPLISFWTEPLSFMAALVIARIILDTLSAKALERVPDHIHHHIINRILGIIPGLINGFIWAALLATIFLLIPLTRVSKQTRDSRFSESLITKVSWLERKLSPIFSEALNKTFHKTTIEDSTEGTVKLPFIVKSPKERPDIASEMLILVNKERTKRGLNALKADPEIAVVALKHSADMFARGYFSHYTPEGLNPFDRMKKGNIRFYTAGENLALAQTLGMAHTGLMNSPGHRANILNSTFGRLGIGVLDGGIYGLIITQNFRN